MKANQATLSKGTDGIWVARDADGNVIVSAKKMHVAKAEIDRWGYEIVPTDDQMRKYFPS